MYSSFISIFTFVVCGSRLTRAWVTDAPRRRRLLTQRDSSASSMRRLPSESTSPLPTLQRRTTRLRLLNVPRHSHSRRRHCHHPQTPRQCNCRQLIQRCRQHKPLQDKQCANDRPVRGAVIERQSSAGVLSLSCARPVVDD